MPDLSASPEAPPGAPASAAPARKVPGWHLHRRLYDWTLSFAHRPGSSWALFWFSFAEASFFPIPPDVLMVPLSLERRERTWFYTFIATVGSVLGGLGGYAIGMAAHHVHWIHKAMVWMFTQEGLDGAKEHLDTLWVITVATIIFHPYKLLTIAAGFFSTSLATFLAGSIIGRAVRFLVVGAVVYWFGPAVKDKIDRYFHALSIILVLLIIGAVVFVRVYGKHSGS
jgi:membrane protein YqaA with SNARE-associated domain